MNYFRILYLLFADSVVQSICLFLNFFFSYRNQMKQSYILVFWSPFPLQELHFCIDFFSPLLKKYGDIQCLDCGCRRDLRTRRLLLQADLVIVSLPQEKDLWDTYFCYEFRRYTNMMYMVMDYFPRESIRPEQICQNYRIPANRLALIPYNIRFREAERKGESRRYLEFRNSPPPYEEYIGFQDELKRSARLFLQALEIM